MNTEDTQRIIELIEDIRNLRADVEGQKDGLEELERKREKLEDEIEGVEDDISADEKRLQELETELIGLTHNESDAPIF